MAYHHEYGSRFLNQPDQRGHDINTLFISGLPEDVKAREIHNLFRRRPGFDYCQLKYNGRGSQVVAFATFVNHSSAMAALHSLNGINFDPNNGNLLHIELARSNSRRKRKLGSGPYFVIDKRSKVATDNQLASSDEDEIVEEEPSQNNRPDSDNENGLGFTKSCVAADLGSCVVADDKEKGGTESQCSTLFIANLGPNCNEKELKDLFSQYPGFNIIKFSSRGSMPVAFADFEGIEQGTVAMEGLQGSLLPSSEGGGIHIEYAKSKMRKSEKENNNT
ncbi:U2 small nuclear ribonucleoprotein B''-like [Impatiens glandulifera]|uniref:U2 small nuclear ribonucleoprotein B''-like n=1 Tax=Impatiens glandulifera TaxID=253017 RepID=UPI001FB148ED|nr:U2 small nuclear ribonucleoprotein B''-like [Impatiens glandulifera]